MARREIWHRHEALVAGVGYPNAKALDDVVPNLETLAGRRRRQRRNPFVGKSHPVFLP